jgi:hypothetical protein
MPVVGLSHFLDRYIAGHHFGAISRADSCAFPAQLAYILVHPFFQPVRYYERAPSLYPWFRLIGDESSKHLSALS